MARDRRFEFAATADPAAAAGLRIELTEWLHAVAVIGLACYEITSSVSEAFLNAVEHPIGRADDEITVEGEISGGEISISVRDQGRWNETVDSSRDHYGFRLMAAQMDSVEVERGAAGTVIVMRRTL